MLRVGVPLFSAIEVLRSYAPKKLLKMYESILNDLTNGMTLSESVKKYKKHFPREIVCMISAGEKGCFLDSALQESSKYLENADSFSGKIKAAVAYPVLVLLVSIVSLAATFLFILPLFASVFDGFDVKLPLALRIMNNFSHLIKSNYLFVVLIMVFTVIGFVYLLRSEKASNYFRVLRYRLPVISKIEINISISRICKILGTTINQGIPVTEALLVCEQSFSGEYNKSLKSIREKVEVGMKIADAIGDDSLFPQALKQMIAVGSESGCLGEILIEASGFYEEEVSKSLKFVLSMAEPAATLSVGIVVFVVVMSVFAPLTQLISKIQ